jgi:hypothetical protein
MTETVTANNEKVGEAMIVDLEAILPEVIKMPSQTILTSDVMADICKILVKNVITELCTEWINDSDTTIAMECGWYDCLVEDYPLSPFISKYFKEALDISDEKKYEELELQHKQYDSQYVRVTVIDDHLVISTKYELLRSYCYQKYQCDIQAIA